jgi:UDP-N-acetylglucosamine/UDP-N-acetylgalactosamine diphosphorylase
MSSPSDIPQALRASFEAAGQQQVFKFVDEGKVTKEQAAELVKQLERIDVKLVNDLFAETMRAQDAPGTASTDADLEAPKEVTKLNACPSEEVARWRSAGLKAISEGKLAALTLAGGQGTRLGFDRPKGEYKIPSLPSGKSLFQLQAERIRRLKVIAGKLFKGVKDDDESLVSLPWFVMTSPMTHEHTLSFLEKHDYFGLPRADVKLFCQGTLPCLSFDGKIMLETGWRVAEAPDGNGGIYRALHLSGLVDEMKTRGIVGVHVFAVDNAIVRPADPVFLGYCLEKEADIGSKVCPKAGPHEKVGVLCKRKGAWSVVEYSEMKKETAELKDASTGELLFNAGNLCIHYYSLNFLMGPAHPDRLPKVYHVAKKAIPTAHPDTGLTLKKEEMPKGNTGIKLESFIFDIFPSAQRMAVMEIVREEEFSPVKNAPGSPDGDSPDTARELLLQQHRRWLQDAGAVVSNDVHVEVSPLVSYAGEGLKEALKGKDFGGASYSGSVSVVHPTKETAAPAAGITAVPVASAAE